MLKTNLVGVFSRVEQTHRILQQVDQEMRLQLWQRQERTKHACKNCTYFDDNDYLPCTLHPDLALHNANEMNNCRDWELNQLRIEE